MDLRVRKYFIGERLKAHSCGTHILGEFDTLQNLRTALSVQLNGITLSAGFLALPNSVGIVINPPYA